MKRRTLTIQQIDDICWYHNTLNSLPAEARPYFEWYVDYCTTFGAPKVFERMDDHVL